MEEGLASTKLLEWGDLEVYKAQQRGPDWAGAQGEEREWWRWGWRRRYQVTKDLEAHRRRPMRSHGRVG